jgi:hypothetical protein
MNAHKFSRFGSRLVRFGIPLLLTLLAAGCETAQKYSLTYKLWDEGSRPFSRPAPEPHLALFTSPANDDPVAAYDALSERNDRLDRRAYFIHTNEARIVAGKPPRYVDLSVITNLTSRPVVTTTNAVTNEGILARYPVNTDRGPGFELYRDGAIEGAYALPVYDEQKYGTVTRVALTPVAVAGDTLMAGVVVGTFGALLWLAAGCPPFSSSQ